MRQTIIALAAVMLVLPGLTGTVLADTTQVPVQEYQLDNGMRLLLVERHDNPTVIGGWVAHVGSADEEAGATGIAHLFEHMMFKGSTTIGTTDAAEELAIMRQLDDLRIKMEAEYTKLREAKRRGEVEGSIYLPENRTPELKRLADEMKVLQEEQHRYIVKDEYDQVYTEMGASGMNAFTNQDMTTYFITVPSNKLELWFWMESERLLNPVFREFYSERDVVREERRMRVESNPTSKFEEQFDAMFWTSSPYHHPVVGWPSDVESISREQANRFFDTYYAPNNLTAAVVGDFDTDEVLELARAYFGRIPRGETPPPEVVTEELDQLQERRMVAEADTNPSVQIRWRTVPFVNADQHALDILSSILAGRTGRFYKGLVEEKGLATGEPYAYNRSLRLDGMFEVGAELADGVPHQVVEDALLAEIDRLKTEPVPAEELQKIKNQTLANSYRRLQSNFFLMLQLLIYDAMGDWQYLNEAPAALQAVTAEDVMRVAETYFTPEGRNTLWYVREQGSEEDPALAGLEGQAKAMAKSMIAQIAGETDAARLEQALGQMRGSIGGAPDDFKPAMKVIIAKIEERLAEINQEKGE